MKTSLPLERPLTQSEALQFLGISRATLYRLDRSGVGPKATRIGRRVLYLPSEIQAFLAEQTAPVQSVEEGARQVG